MKRHNINTIRRIYVILLIAGIVLASAKSGFCQANTPCLFPHSDRECTSFLIFESNLLYRSMESSIPEERHNLRAATEAGYIQNIKENIGLGGTIYIAVDDFGSQLGLKFRYRQWLGPRTALDISPGIIFYGDDRWNEGTYPGFTGSLSFSYNNLIGLTAQVNVIGYDRPVVSENFIESDTGTQTSVYFGVQFGSYAALSSPLLMLIALAAE